MAERLQGVLVSGEANTTDATITTLATWAVPDNCVGHVFVTIVGRRTNGTGERMAMTSIVAVKKHSGTLTIAETVLATHNDTASVFTVDVSANNLRARATGVAANNISWRAIIQSACIFQP